MLTGRHRNSHAIHAQLSIVAGVCLSIASGCGALPKVVSANESRVIVRDGSAAEATDLAIKACARYGKTDARFSHAEGWTFWFECV
jgi:hypothetical protein